MDFNFNVSVEDISEDRGRSFKIISEDREIFNYKIFISYEHAHIGADKYSITNISSVGNYFQLMKKFCGHTMNELLNTLSHDYHFYDTPKNDFIDFIKAKNIKFVRDVHNGILKHISLNYDKKCDENVERLHFVIGADGEINILIYDPNHEISGFSKRFLKF